jgi:probable O-glycosylation ligase (exosortase A-associated)
MKAMFAFTIVTIIFTYSRGAFVGLVVILAVLIWRSPWRLRFATAVVIVAVIGAPLAPIALKERMSGIRDQESAETRDKSAAGRIEAWHTAWGVAVAHPFFGEGFKALWNTEIWNIYFGNDYLVVRDVHSLYFEILSEHGILGFIIYLGILFTTLSTLRRIRKRWRDDPDHGYLSHYAEMTELAIYPFLVAGAFLGVAYFDLYLLLVGTSTLLWTLSRQAEAVAVATDVRHAVKRSAAALRITGSLPRSRHA